MTPLIKRMGQEDCLLSEVFSFYKRYYSIYSLCISAIKAIIISSLLLTPHEIAQHIAHAARTKRLTLNLSQKTVSQRSGVSLGTLKNFERTGQISLESLLKLALILDALETFQDLFKPTPPEDFPSLDALLVDTTRKRGRT